MTQEDKQLLLTDLCARLPYGIKVLYNEINCVIENIGRDGSISLISDDSTHKKAIYLTSIEYIKPYLLPMSSMTEEKKDEMFGFCTLSDCSVNTDWETVGIEIMSSHPRYGDYYSTDYKVIDWLNKKMFDYRGLIPKGLAIEAPEGMYRKEEQSLILKEKLIKEIFTKSGFYGNFIPTKEKLNKLNEAYKEAIESLYRGNDE